MAPKLPFDQFLYGGDWNPEQWLIGPPDASQVWRDDVRLMREAGVNTVSVGVFAWAALQPAEDRFTFGWLDEVLGLLAENGISANLGTATAAQPAWLSAAYPDVLPVDELGRRRRHGGRMNFCPTSPDFRRLATGLVRQLAERYGSHEALRLWHVSNEYGPTCHCDRCAGRFRNWLAARHGDLAGLNRAWETSFWGHTFSAWDQVEPPGPLGEMSMQGLALDWHRFVSDMNLECFTAEASVLREMTPDVPVLTNFHGATHLDYATWVRHEDIVAYDSYPTPDEPPELTSFRFDLMRGLGRGASWLLLEQTPSQTQWQPYNVLRRPGEVRLHSYRAIARGSDGAMYFQWRASRGAQEMHHGAIVDHSGRSDTRTFREVAALGAELAALPAAMLGTRVPARVGLIYSWPVRWALEFSPRLSLDLDYVGEVVHYYAALWRRNVAVDVISPDAPLDGYDAVIAPLLHLVTEPQAGAIERYVHGGGRFLTTYFSGVVDDDGRAWPGDRPGPSALHRALGIWVEAVDPMLPGQAGSVVAPADGPLPSGAALCDLWSEMVHPDGARAIATFGQGIFSGAPAATHNSYGSGQAWYVATRPEPRFVDALLGAVLDGTQISGPLPVPAGVEVVERVGPGGAFTFLLGRGAGVETVTLPAPMRDLLTGLTHPDSIAIEPRGVAVLVPAATTS